MARDAVYDEKIAKIAQSYTPAALALLEEIRAQLASEGFAVSEPSVDFGDDYRWSIGTLGPDGTMHPEDIDCTITLAEEREYENDIKPGKGGVTFIFDAVQAESGRIIGEMKPFNYSHQLWVDLDDVEAVRARWDLLAAGDYSSLGRQITAVGMEAVA